MIRVKDLVSTCSHICQYKIDGTVYYHPLFINFTTLYARVIRWRMTVSGILEVITDQSM